MILAKLKNFREILLLAGIVLILLISWLITPSFQNVILHRQGQSLPASVPISEPMMKGEEFSVEMDISSSIGTDFDIEIHPDDCITGLIINEVNLPFKTYPGYCSWNNGFILSKTEIQKHLPENISKFHILFSVKNGNGLGGINMLLKTSGFLTSLLTILFFGLIAGFIFSVGTRFHIDRRLLLFFFIGMLLRCDYTQKTFFDQRGHDVGGHLHYIQIIAHDNHIPEANECWTCYHPPVYFLASAGIWDVSEWFHCTPQNAVKWFDFILSLIALAFGIACIKNSLWGSPRYLATLLWCIWPGFILASPRIGNDILFYATHIAALWGCINYLKTNHGKYFLVAVLSAVTAYWTKSTAAVTFGLVGLTFLIQALSKLRFKFSKLEWTSIILLLVSGGVALFRIFHGGIVGNAGGNDNSVLIQNTPGNFLFFDIHSFIVHPFIDPWRDELGRQFFWNYLAKTSLFGEFHLLETTAGQWLATLASVSFLILLIFGLRGFWVSKWTKIKFLLTAQAIFFFAAMILLRLKYPFSCSNDFRYIIPVLLSCLPWVAEGICGEKSSTKIKICGWGVAIIFAISSSALLLSL